MSGRPVRRRVLADVERAGGWRVVLARIASGEPVAAIARSFGVSRSFFSALLHEDRDRHELAVEARRQTTGHERLAETVKLLPGERGTGRNTAAVCS
jgi:hypothetical protein